MVYMSTCILMIAMDRGTTLLKTGLLGLNLCEGKINGILSG
jgi:hypothetical protein